MNQDVKEVAAKLEYKDQVHVAAGGSSTSSIAGADPPLIVGASDIVAVPVAGNENDEIIGLRQQVREMKDVQQVLQRQNEQHEREQQEREHQGQRDEEQRYKWKKNGFHAASALMLIGVITAIGLLITRQQAPTTAGLCLLLLAVVLVLTLPHCWQLPWCCGSVNS